MPLTLLKHKENNQNTKKTLAYTKKFKLSELRETFYELPIHFNSVIILKCVLTKTGDSKCCPTGYQSQRESKPSGRACF